MCMYNVNEKKQEKETDFIGYNIPSLEIKFLSENDDIQKKNEEHNKHKMKILLISGIFLIFFAIKRVICVFFF